MPGGWQRDGWWPAGIGRGKLLRKGVPGTAAIKKFEKLWGEGEHNQADMTLEVRLEGREPYDVQGCFSFEDAVPAVQGTPNGARILDPGSVVAVRVHPRKRKKVAIDWKASVPARPN
jgi:hypothetical protein